VDRPGSSLLPCTSPDRHRSGLRANSTAIDGVGLKTKFHQPDLFPRFLLCVRDDQAQAIFKLGHRGAAWCDHEVDHLNETDLRFTARRFYFLPQHPDDHRSAHSQLTATALRSPNNSAAKSV
jgi:hypothetical protein